MTNKIEGYWYSEYHTEYPKPVPDVLSQEAADKIYLKIKDAERDAEMTRYRGVSMSRIDSKTIVGSAEYSRDGWAWPAGFAEHYVKLHRVKPTDEFLEFIGYNDQE